jgi:hypothetical protein
LRHGIKRDGRSVRMMPVGDANWLRDDDFIALLSYVRSVPAVNRANGPIEISVMGKVLDRRNAFPLDIARRIDHDRIEQSGPAEPTVAYGRFVGRLCTGCHGETLSGGRPEGWPPNFPVPSNLTPHETGLKDWTYADFTKMLDTGARKNGELVRAPMPRDSFKYWDETERQATWAYLRSLPALPLGRR